MVIIGIHYHYLGESGVGKTNIISRYTLDKFHICNNATVGVEFVSKPIQL